eukprot:365360-Chlamydomonas_euryale.AAC.6
MGVSTDIRIRSMCPAVQPTRSCLQEDWYTHHACKWEGEMLDPGRHLPSQSTWTAYHVGNECLCRRHMRSARTV